MDLVTLSDRENDIIHFLRDGLTNKEIAIFLNISPNTVKSHVNSIFNKLGVQNRTQAAVRSVCLGVLPSMHIKASKGK